jgi:gluconate kinase
VTDQTEVLLIGGRSGVGKSAVGAEMHVQLSAVGVRHCLIEGDNLDMAYPPPLEHGLAEQNLSAMWANYRALGYRRMIYTNTASVLEKVIRELTTAMTDEPQVTAVLLTCNSATARRRLSQREIGTALDWHVERSDLMARKLDKLAPSWVHRVVTDGRAVVDIATEIVGLCSWVPE